MVRNRVKMIRYGTAAEQKYVDKFKDEFDLLMVNANMICHASASISKFVATKQIKYVIDPMTHSFQHSPDFLKSNTTGKIKKSIEKMLDNYPDFVKNKILSDQVLLSSDFSEIEKKSEFVYKTIMFQKNHVKMNIEGKDFNKYIKFLEKQSQIDYSPEYLIAPYFMINTKNMNDWLPLNINFIKIAKELFPEEKISAQLIIQKDVLFNKNEIQKIAILYGEQNIKNLFLWVDDFSAFDSSLEELENFYSLLKGLTKSGVEVYNLYGSFFSTLLCHPSLKYGLSGNCHGMEYGEKRGIIPVGGGVPINKYYLPAIHQRVNYGTVANLMLDLKILPDDYKRYYEEICKCKQCTDLIGTNLSKFSEYGGSKPIEMKRKGMSITRNYPTTEAKQLCINHFLYSKLNEWQVIEQEGIGEILEKCQNAADEYKIFIGSDTSRLFNMWTTFFNDLEKNDE